MKLVLFLEGKPKKNTILSISLRERDKQLVEKQIIMILFNITPQIELY